MSSVGYNYDDHAGFCGYNRRTLHRRRQSNRMVQLATKNSLDCSVGTEKTGQACSLCDSQPSIFLVM